MKVIIYNQDNGIPAVVMPTQEALDAHGIMAIAIKDVPMGKPFKIINTSDMQSILDHPQEVWSVDESDLTDGIGAERNEFN
jgi:hypothetical protein